MRDLVWAPIFASHDDCRAADNGRGRYRYAKGVIIPPVALATKSNNRGGSVLNCKEKSVTIALLKEFDVNYVSVRLVEENSSRKNQKYIGNCVNQDQQKIIECKVCDLLEYHETHDSGLNVSDISSGSSGLKHMNEAALLHVLQTRYGRDRVSTTISSSESLDNDTSSVAIYINPCKSLPDIFDIHKYYSSLISHRERDAHIFSLSRKAMDAVTRREHNSIKNAVVVVTGESGSGKTEATKLMMKFVLDKVTALKKDQFHKSLSSNLISTHAILESFGHCSTPQCRNASRASNYYKITFDGSVNIPQILGVHVCSYLFDKARVHTQGSGESNFNIFYEMLKGMDGKMQSKLLLTSLSASHAASRSLAFKYLSNDTAHSGMFSATNRDTTTRENANSHNILLFDSLRQALEGVGIDKNAQFELFRLLACVLHMGNISFRSKNSNDRGVASAACSLESIPCEVIKTKFFYFIEETLGISSSNLNSSKDDLLSTDNITFTSFDRLLTTKIVSNPRGRTSVYSVELDVKQATDIVTFMAVDIYDRLYRWLVQKCNESLTSSPSNTEAENPYICYLDMFGFEYEFGLGCEENKDRDGSATCSLVSNQLQQFMINYAAERVNRIFVNSLFVFEKNAYSSEGIPFPLNPAGKTSYGDGFAFDDNMSYFDAVDGVQSQGRVGILKLFEQCEMKKHSEAAGGKEPIACQLPQDISNFCSDSKIASISCVCSSDLGSVPTTANTLASLGRRLPVKTPVHTFSIKHFLGEVVYSMDDFEQQNIDLGSGSGTGLLGENYRHIISLLGQSKNSLIRELFKEPCTINKPAVDVWGTDMLDVNDSPCSPKIKTPTRRMTLQATNSLLSRRKSKFGTSVEASKEALLKATHDSLNEKRKRALFTNEFRAHVDSLASMFDSPTRVLEDSSTPVPRHVQFLQCVAPNRKQKPDAFDPAVVLHQLQRTGIVAFAALKSDDISGCFPVRQTYEEVHNNLVRLDLYRGSDVVIPAFLANKNRWCMGTNPAGCADIPEVNYTAAYKSCVMQLFSCGLHDMEANSECIECPENRNRSRTDSSEAHSSMWKEGASGSILFLKSNIYEVLRLHQRRNLVVTMQRIWRGAIVRTKVFKFIRGLLTLQRVARQRVWYKRYKFGIQRGVVVIQAIMRMWIARERFAAEHDKMERTKAAISIQCMYRMYCAQCTVLKILHFRNYAYIFQRFLVKKRIQRAAAVRLIKNFVLYRPIWRGKVSRVLFACRNISRWSYSCGLRRRFLLMRKAALQIQRIWKGLWVRIQWSEIAKRAKEQQTLRTELINAVLWNDLPKLKSLYKNGKNALGKEALSVCEKKSASGKSLLHLAFENIVVLGDVDVQKDMELCRYLMAIDNNNKLGKGRLFGGLHNESADSKVCVNREALDAQHRTVFHSMLENTISLYRGVYHIATTGEELKEISFRQSKHSLVISILKWQLLLDGDKDCKPLKHELMLQPDINGNVVLNLIENAVDLRGRTNGDWESGDGGLEITKGTIMYRKFVEVVKKLFGYIVHCIKKVTLAKTDTLAKNLRPSFGVSKPVRFEVQEAKIKSDLSMGTISCTDANYDETEKVVKFVEPKPILRTAPIHPERSAANPRRRSIWNFTGGSLPTQGSDGSPIPSSILPPNHKTMDAIHNISFGYNNTTPPVKNDNLSAECASPNSRKLLNDAHSVAINRPSDIFSGSHSKLGNLFAMRFDELDETSTVDALSVEEMPTCSTTIPFGGTVPTRLEINVDLGEEPQINALGFEDQGDVSEASSVSSLSTGMKAYDGRSTREKIDIKNKTDISIAIHNAKIEDDMFASLSPAFAALKRQIEEEERDVSRRRSDCMEVKYRKEQDRTNAYNLGRKYSESISSTKSMGESDSKEANLLCSAIFDHSFHVDYEAVDMESPTDRDKRRLERHSKIKQQRKEREHNEGEHQSLVPKNGDSLKRLIEMLDGIEFVSGSLERKKSGASNVNKRNWDMSHPMHSPSNPYQATYHPVLDVFGHIAASTKDKELTSKRTAGTDRKAIEQAGPLRTDAPGKRRMKRFSMHSRKSIAPPGVHANAYGCY